MSDKREVQFTSTRRQKVVSKGLKLRHSCTDCDAPFDPLRFVEHKIEKLVEGYDLDPWDEHPSFLERPDRLAFVDFSEGARLFIRPSVMDAAAQNDNEARFVIAHEIAHIFLHRDKAKQLSRHKNTSKEHNYSANPHLDLELEANAFAGALLVPIDTVQIIETHHDTLLDIRSIAQKYRVSNQVAQRAKMDAISYRERQRKKK